MFEAADFDRDQIVDALAIPANRRDASLVAHSQKPYDLVQLDKEVRTILATGFKARVMSWQSAYALGARNNLSLDALRERISQCARLIDAGLGCAVDETLFAALVYHYAPLARDIASSPR